MKWFSWITPINADYFLLKDFSWRWVDRAWHLVGSVELLDRKITTKAPRTQRN